MKVYETDEHEQPPVPNEAPGPGPCDDLSLRERDALYADGEKVRGEYVILASMQDDDAWITLQRRDRLRFDGEQPLAVDLEEWR